MTEDLAEAIRRRKAAIELNKDVESLNKDTTTSWRNPTKRKTGSNPLNEPEKEIKKTVTLEIDFDLVAEHICKNHKLIDGFANEHKIYKRVFAPYKKGNTMTTTGRDHWVWVSLKAILTKLAPKIIKKVTREEVI